MRRHRFRLLRRTGRWFVAGLVLSIATASILLGVGMANTRASPIARETVVAMPGLAGGPRATKVALLSDIHLGNRAMAPARLRAIVEQVNAARPDLVLLAGDFVIGHDARGAAGRATGLTGPLSRLSAPLGVVAVLGNHDHWTAPDAVRAALSKSGIIVLENQAVRLGPFAVVGIGDRFSRHDDVRASLAAARHVGGVPIVLTHSPDLVPDLPAGLPLVLAGHTHCGQVVIPGLGVPVARSPLVGWRRLYDPRYRCGIVRDGQRTTIVTAGLGSGSAPVRFGAMPDWWLVTLRPDLAR